MIAPARLTSVIVGGVLASAACIIGTLPADAQAPATTVTTPAPAPPTQTTTTDTGGVDWGTPSEDATERRHARRHPVASPPAPRNEHRRPEHRAATPDRDSKAPNDTKDDCSIEPDDLDLDALRLATDPTATREELRAERERREAEWAQHCAPHHARHHRHASPTHAPDATPTPDAPGFMSTMPGPSSATGVPNFVIDKFRVPPFLLSIYQAAGIQYGVRWQVLAAINEIETDYGRNLNVSSAGAAGWMQFIPSTWRMYGVDANKDGVKDPYNPVDAIFAAARYLKAAGYQQDTRRAVFAYNHAGWYVDSVMLRARLIAGVPADLIGSLTGLTEGRFPVAARARYAQEHHRRDPSTRIFTREDAPVVATQDGRVIAFGRSRTLGRYVVLADAYGNHYAYAHLGSVAKRYPVPKRDALGDPRAWARAIRANEPEPSDPRPTRAASAGRQPENKSTAKRSPAHRSKKAHPSGAASHATQPTATKRRLFAHPYLPAARSHGGEDQMLASQSGKGANYDGYFARPFGLDGRNVRLTRLKKGSQVIGGTVLGRVGAPRHGTASHVDFSIRPAGKGAPQIDPKPILDGWKLLEATSIYRASGRNALDGDAGAAGASALSIGEILLLPKPELEKRVLADPRVKIYADGRQDIESGQIDRRVLATLEYLASSGLEPTVTCLKTGHGFLTASGNVSEHSSGNAVDIGAINGVPIAGHQQRGGITEQTVRKLMLLQGTLQPHQIISLLDLGANTMALADHADHIHVGFHPRFGTNARAGREAMAVLAPGQWSDLLDRLRQIDQPDVPTHRSRFAIPVRKR